MSLKPLGDRVLLKILETEEKTEGGIFLPDTAQEKPQKGEVVAVGTGKVLADGKKVPIEVKVGDKVIFSRYAGDEVKDGEEKYLLVNERDILGVID
ncbi:MAG: co-chaperone GroES [Thermacetogeniaceae bacterium]|nr:co-chaperone GroES [Syntrophomonadaceae bacterium]